MKHLLIIALLLSSIQSTAQVSGPPGSNLHIISGGKVIFPPGTIIYPGMCSKPPDSGSGGHIAFSTGLGKITHLIDSSFIIHVVYRDTVINPPANGIYTHPAYQLLNTFYYSYYNKAHDTEFVYDHFQWLLHRINEEVEYWDLRYAKTNDLSKRIEADRKIVYYTGMQRMLENILYKQEQTDRNFKSIDKSKRRTK